MLHRRRDRRRSRAGGVAPPVGKLNVPDRFDATHELRDALFDAYARTLGVGPTLREATGAEVHVGVVDTIRGPPTERRTDYYVPPGLLDRELDVVPPGEHADREEATLPEELLDFEDPDPSGHGTWVLDAITAFAPDARFTFYPALGADERELSNFGLFDAIEAADADGVAVLNVSAGVGHEEDCGGHCMLGRAVRGAAANGVTVVAAAGNLEDDPEEHVNCPARPDEAIAVGGFVPWCEADADSLDDDRRLYADTTARTGFPDRQGPFCNQEGCSRSRDCATNRTETWWQFNVERVDGNPDVVAPVHYPVADATGAFFVPGTSFAAPLVSGILAAMLGLPAVDGDVTPDACRRAVERSGTSIDGGGAEKLDAGALLRLLD